MKTGVERGHWRTDVEPRLQFLPGGEKAALSQFSSVSLSEHVPNYATGSEKDEALTLMIQTLFKKNALFELKPVDAAFFNLVFLRPKKHDVQETRLNKRWRLILDVSVLN